MLCVKSLLAVPHWQQPLPTRAPASFISLGMGCVLCLARHTSHIVRSPPSHQTNAATIGDMRLGEFGHLSSLLLPLYSPRAAELAFFGKDGVSLATAAPIADCFQIA